MVKHKQEHSDIGPSAYFAKLGKKKVNKKGNRKTQEVGSWQPHSQ